MALNTFKCNYLTPLHFKGLRQVSQSKECLQNRQNGVSDTTVLQGCEQVIVQTEHDIKNADKYLRETKTES